MSHTPGLLPRSQSMAPPAKRQKKEERKAIAKLPRTPLQKPFGLGIPGSMRTKLKYVVNDTMSSASGGVDQRFYRAGGAYDPEFAIGGHQPMYYDQYSVLYNHYIVHGSTIKVTISPQGSTAWANPGYMVLHGDDNAIDGGSVFTIMERARSRHTLIPQFGTDGVVHHLNMAYDKNKIFKNFKNAELQASTAALPTDDWYFGLTWQSGGTTGTLTCAILVEIVYDIEFFEPKEVSAS